MNIILFFGIRCIHWSAAHVVCTINVAIAFCARCVRLLTAQYCLCAVGGDRHKTNKQMRRIQKKKNYAFLCSSKLDVVIRLLFSIFQNKREHNWVWRQKNKTGKWVSDVCVLAADALLCQGIYMPNWWWWWWYVFSTHFIHCFVIYILIRYERTWKI